MFRVENSGFSRTHCPKPTSATGFKHALHTIHYLQRKEKMEHVQSIFYVLGTTFLSQMLMTELPEYIGVILIVKQRNCSYPFVASATARM